MENMASFPDLRSHSRSAKAGRRAASIFRAPVLLAVSTVLLLTAFFAVSELATLRGAKAHDASAFLTRELGSPLNSAPLVREPARHTNVARVRPAVGAKLEIVRDGLEVTSGATAVSLRYGKPGPRSWRQYERGVSRTTAFGNEAIAFGRDRIEQSLLVNRRQGRRTWLWRLGTICLNPSLTSDGSVRFAAKGAVSGLRILPVAILDLNGKDITPAGLRWSLARDRDGRWLELRLDDTKLPLPYVIDPIVLVGTCPGAFPGDFNGCSVHIVSNKANFTSSPLVRPASVNTGDLMVAQVTVRNNDVINPPAGWTAIGNRRIQGGALEQALFYRIATAADTVGTTYSWAWTNNADASAAILAYSGVDATNPFDGTPTDNSGNSGTASATGLTTTQNGDMVIAFYGAQGNVTAVQSGSESVTQEYTVISGSGPSRARSTGADGTQASPGATGSKTATVTAAANWVAHLAALMPALSADGSGTLTTPTTDVSASQTGRTLDFTYTAATNGMMDGTVTLVVPSDWSAPSTTGSSAGYSTSSAGTLTVASQTITISNLTTGTSAVSASQTGQTVTFTYTAATGGISNGSVTLAVPSGWSAPSTTSSNAGYTTASSGTVSVASQTITVSSLTVSGGSTFTITYGDTSGGGPGATATSSTGAQTWQAQAKSTSGGSLTNLASSPGITVYAADGSGTLTTPTTNVSASQTDRTLTFTYTAATGGISNGSVTLDVPSGWSAPSTTGSNAGYSTSSAGTLSVSSQSITVSSLTLAGGATFTITYGSTAGGGPGATATSTTGAQTWQAQQRSTSGGTLTNLGSSPSITAYAADGSGTLTTPTTTVAIGSSGNTITFTYAAATGGLSNGTVTVDVPSGWSAPSTTGSNAGYTTSSTGTVSVAGQTITVSSVTLADGATMTITYGGTGSGGPGATSPVPAGAQTWQAQENSSSGGTLTNLCSSPSIPVNDTTAPSVPSLTFGSFTNASVTGTTVYIRQGSAGGFTVTGTSADVESGIDHLTFPSGFGTGWTGGGTDSSSPYNGVYTFSAAATAPGGSQDVTATNGWTLTSGGTPFTVVADTTPPSVTAPGVTAGYYTSLSVPVTKNGGSDAGSGVDSSTSVLERDEVGLTNGSCGSFPGSWSTVTLSGGNDTTVVSGNCYRYRELLSDNVGNQGSSSASNSAKVDTSAPSTPTLAFSGLSANAYWDGSSTLFFRPSAGGAFTVTAAAGDGQSGIGSYTFGTLNSNGGSNWGGSQTGDHFDHTFSGSTTAPSTARTISATNGAGTSSSDATYTIAADTTAPSMTAPSVTAGYFTSLSVPVTKNGGSDGGAGIDASTTILQRDTATLTNGSCGSFPDTWSTVTLVGGNDTSVSNGECYQYRELLSDRVGNQGTSAASNIARVDAQAPANSISLSSVSPAGSALKNEIGRA